MEKIKVLFVCDEANAERCPIFPAATNRFHWSVEDPSSCNGSHEDKLAKTRLVRDAIKSKVQDFINIQHA